MKTLRKVRVRDIQKMVQEMKAVKVQGLALRVHRAVGNEIWLIYLRKWILILFQFTNLNSNSHDTSNYPTGELYFRMSIKRPS
jgi:hypothetical protein